MNDRATANPEQELSAIGNSLRHPSSGRRVLACCRVLQRRRTEVALRLARHLLARHLVTGSVHVALTGHELTRRDQPPLPVVRYLAERACALEEPLGAWQGRYVLKGADHALRLHDQPDIGDAFARGYR